MCINTTNQKKKSINTTKYVMDVLCTYDITDYQLKGHLHFSTFSIEQIWFANLLVKKWLPHQYLCKSHSLRKSDMVHTCD